MENTTDTKLPASPPLPAPTGSAIDMPGAAFDVETELAILMGAQRLIQSNAVQRIGWHTWDSWAGRMEYHEETSENWLRRILRQAMRTVLPNVEAHWPGAAPSDATIEVN